ncbi:MAG: hypothetical protein MJZ16_14125 [Bacteroidales bacterium]|nr:hypothetical protein [Bacteroidales bacterium]
MNRAERRRQERELKSKKTVERITTDVMTNMNERIERKVQKESSERIEWIYDVALRSMMACCAIALHREFGFGADRTFRVLTAMDKLIEEYLFDPDEKAVFNLIDLCDKEVGIKLER